MDQYAVGLDLGQAQDFSTLAIVQKSGEEYHVRGLERFRLGTPYPAIVERVQTVAHRLPEGTALVVDATGVGAPVVDLFRSVRLHPVAVTITGGDTVSHDKDNNYRVPKRNLVSTLAVLLQSGRLKIARSLPEAATLTKELLNFRVRIDPATAHDSYAAWREGDHDDLVLATAMACWYAQYQAGTTGHFQEGARYWGGTPQFASPPEAGRFHQYAEELDEERTQ
jgi:phage FluMu gp28-like protein